MSERAADDAIRLRPFAEAATFIAGRIRGAARERGTCDLVLAGGHTPRAVYEQLTRPEEAGPVPWQKVRWFWGDERFVPQSHEASNYRMACEALLERVRPPATNVFPIPTDAPDATRAAADYEGLLRGLFPGAALPVFDLVLLGLGADGHTASLFPGGPECEEWERWCVASLAPEGSPARERVTLTLPALSAARCVAFLVAGEDKRGALQALLHAGPGETRGAGLPARRVRPRELYCFTDLQ